MMHYRPPSCQLVTMLCQQHHIFELIGTPNFMEAMHSNNDVDRDFNLYYEGMDGTFHNQGHSDCICNCSVFVWLIRKLM